jgi:hypothetical protein
VPCLFNNDCVKDLQKSAPGTKASTFYPPRVQVRGASPAARPRIASATPPARRGRGGRAAPLVGGQ